MPLWEGADRVCGKRLKALIPALIDAMEWHGASALAQAGRLSSLAGKSSR
jgi:hypothetical protein